MSGDSGGNQKAGAVVWKIIGGVAIGALIGSNAFWIQASIRDDVRFFRDSATRTDLKSAQDELRRADSEMQARFDVRSQKIEDNACAIASLSAEVLSTLRSMQGQLTRVEEEVNKLRDGKGRTP